MSEPLTDAEIAEWEQSLNEGGACDSPEVRRRLLAEVKRLKEIVLAWRTCDACGVRYDRANGGYCKCGKQRWKNAGLEEAARIVDLLPTDAICVHCRQCAAAAIRAAKAGE